MSRKAERSAEQREAARRERERRRAEREGRPIPPEAVEPPESFDAPAVPTDPTPPPGSSEAFGEAAAPADLFAPHGGEPAAPDPFAPHGGEPFAPEPFAPHGGEPAAPAEPFAPHGGEPFAASHADPQATQQWDVEVEWSDEPAADPVAPAQPTDLPAGPPVAGGSTPPADRDPDRDPTRPHADPGAEPDPGDPGDPHGTQPPTPAPHADEHPTARHDASDAPDWGATWTDDQAAAAGSADEVPLGTRRVSGYRRPSLPNLHRPGHSDRASSGRRRPRMRRPGELGPPRRRSSRGGRIAGGVAVVLVLAIGWFLVSLFQPFGDGEGSGAVRVRIPQGAGAGDIGSLLANKGVVSSGFFFNLRATLSGDRGSLKSGTYTLRRDMSYAAALSALTADAPAPPPTIHVTIPEGRSRRETAAAVRRAGIGGDYLTATRRSTALNPSRYGAPRGATLEGFLFPATYELRRGASVQVLVDEQLAAFKRTFRSVDLGYAKRKNLTAYDVLTIASMVEREVSVPKERPLVAAVIYNRLAQGIPLGIDATLRYERNDWVNPLKQSVLDANTPFNTRIRSGLPPGPIGSPGLASIKAAARPARVGYLYYVVDACKPGQHVFANTYEEHLANVARYDRARQAAGGRGLKC